jgi:formate dehydrogenase major subunit
MVIGANPTEGHPVTGARLKQHIMKGTPLIVIDPRKIELVPYAKHHLQLRPGTNVALLNMFAAASSMPVWSKPSSCASAAKTGRSSKPASKPSIWPNWKKSPVWPLETVRAAALEYASAEAAMSFHGLGVTEHEQGAKRSCSSRTSP